MIVAGLVGSRIVYGLVNAGEFARVCFHGGGEPRSAGAVLSDCTRILRDLAGRPGVLRRRRGRGAGRLALRAARGLVVRRVRRSVRARRWRSARVRAARLLRRRLLLRQGGRRRAGPSAFPRGSGRVRRAGRDGRRSRPGWDTTPGLHPTQLYEAVGELAIFAALLAAAPARPPPPGHAARGVPRPLRAAALRRRDVPRRRRPRPRRRARDAAPRRLAPPAAAEPIFLSVGQLGSLVVLALCAVVWTAPARSADGVPTRAGPHAARSLP